jgi:hypothetical protein
MGVSKVMIIRHAEKPGTYDDVQYSGINAQGQPDDESLVTLGWERAGGIANLFSPTNDRFQSPELTAPAHIYAANPAIEMKLRPDGNILQDEPSQRPYQTISALYGKMRANAKQPPVLNIAFDKDDYGAMVAHVLALPGGAVLISWQHEDILPRNPGDSCVVGELLKQSGSVPPLDLPAGPWPGNRYDMVLVFDRPSGAGPFTAFTQVPQMLLAGDTSARFEPSGRGR